MTGDAEFRIQDVTLGEESIVSGDFKGVVPSKVKLVCYDADKKTIPHYSNYSSFNNQKNIKGLSEDKAGQFFV